MNYHSGEVVNFFTLTYPDWISLGPKRRGFHGEPDLGEHELYPFPRRDQVLRYDRRQALQILSGVEHGPLWWHEGGIYSVMSQAAADARLPCCLGRDTMIFFPRITGEHIEEHNLPLKLSYLMQLPALGRNAGDDPRTFGEE